MTERRPLLVHGGTIHTMDPARPTAAWMSVLGDRVQWLGDGPPPPFPRALDLGGRTVLPGFVDAHAHFFQTGLDLLFVDLAGATTLDEVADRLRAGARGKRGWLFAHGFEEDRLTDARRLTAADLDHIFPERPVWVNRVDYHSAIVNTPALRRLEIPIGLRGFATEGGRPLGILRAEAYMYAKPRISRLYPVELREKAVRAAVKACVRKGITAVHALEGGRIFGDEGVPTLLKSMGSLPLDVTLFLQEMNLHITSRLGFDHLGGCILIDGSIGSYTAALDVDYVGQPGRRGELYEKPKDLGQFVQEAHDAGMQLAFHAIGPRAIGQVLDAYDRALARNPRFDHRHRIEHFELASDAQIARARDLGVVPSMQPAFEHYWGGPHGMYASRLGEGWRSTNRLRTILDAGLRIAGGSDTNVTPPDPLLGIHAAVHHPNPDQRVTVPEALRMMTIDAAYAAFNDKRHGSLSPGKEASFVVLDQDPLTVPTDALRDLQVEQTWFRGRRVWARD